VGGLLSRRCLDRHRRPGVGRSSCERRSARYPDEPFLWSEVHLPDDPMYAGSSLDLPCVACGVDATDDVIGW
jgi:hypothetical protein